MDDLTEVSNTHYYAILCFLNMHLYISNIHVKKILKYITKGHI